MFIYSLRASTIKLVGVVCVALTVLITLIAFVPTYADNNSTTAGAGDSAVSYSYDKIKNKDDVINFLSQFGWQVEAEPLEIRDVAIPDPFDEVYLQYNALQKQQGFDLEPLAGKVCRQWVYEVTNYPAETPVHANLLVYEDRVVGGDICSTELDGFMLPFDALGSGNAGAASSAGSSALPESAVSSGTPASSQAPVVSEGAPVSSSEIPANAWPTD